jgi:membrane associated rhomboid family serine protease
MATCYRHPSRETGVSCSNCGKPICPDCMTATPVGMRCPDCSRQKTQTRSLQSIAVEPIVTYVLIAINVAVFIGVQSSSQFNYHDLTLFGSGVYQDGTLHGVAEGEWWRLVSSGFLHTETVHLLLNMLSLFWLGRMIEPALGHARYVAIYLVSLLAGSLGVMILDPNAETLGASGAIYGLLGAAIVMARNRNIDLMQSGLIPILVLNLLLTFVFSRGGGGFTLSIGGHLGGLVGGFIATFVVEEFARRRRDSLVPGIVACAVIGVAAIAGSVALAS